MSIPDNAIKKILLILASTYPWFEAAEIEIQIKIWGTVLKGYDPKVVEASVMEWVAKSSKEPTPADIRQMCETMTPLNPNAIPGEIAWEKLIDAAKSGWSWQRVEEEFAKYPALLRAARGGMYYRVRYADIQTQLPFVKKDFLQDYEVLFEGEERQPITEAGKKLINDIFSASQQRQVGGITKQITEEPVQ